MVSAAIRGLYVTIQEKAAEIERMPLDKLFKGISPQVESAAGKVAAKALGESTAKIIGTLEQKVIQLVNGVQPTIAENEIRKQFAAQLPKIREDIDVLAKEYFPQITRETIEDYMRRALNIQEDFYSGEKNKGEVIFDLRGYVARVRRSKIFTVTGAVITSISAAVAAGAVLYVFYLNRQIQQAETTQLSSRVDTLHQDAVNKIAAAAEAAENNRKSLEERLTKKIKEKELAETKLDAKVAALERDRMPYEGRIKNLEDVNKSFAEEQKKYFAYAQAIEEQTKAIKGDVAALRGLHEKGATKEELKVAYQGLTEKLDKLIINSAENDRRLQKYEDESKKRDEKYEAIKKKITDDVNSLRDAITELGKIEQRKYEREHPEGKNP